MCNRRTIKARKREKQAEKARKKKKAKKREKARKEKAQMRESEERLNREHDAPVAIAAEERLNQIVGMDLKCRFYEDKSPALHDVVMVKVRSVGDKGAYVELLEYNNLRGVFLGFDSNM